MAKTSGGNRGGGNRKKNKIVGFKETEKAIQIEARYSASVAPKGGIASSLVRDVSGTMKIWVPKTQIENGNLSEWIAGQKENEISDFITTKRFLNAQVIWMDMKLNDATGKAVGVKKTKKEQEAFDRSQARKQEAFARAKVKRDSLIEQAKANGYNAHSRMKTSTLERMAEGTYQSRPKRRWRR